VVVDGGAGHACRLGYAPDRRPSNPAFGYDLQRDSRQLGLELSPLAGADPTQVARVLVEVAESFRNFQVVAKREAEQRTELGAGSDVTVTVPYFDDDITDLAGLARLGATLWEPAA
jgi:hypothetical protein